MKIDVHKGLIAHEEFLAFIKGGASLDLNAVQPKPFKWILDITWLNLVEISKLSTFTDILTKVSIFLKLKNIIKFLKNLNFFYRLKIAKENGDFGTKKKNQKKKNYPADIKEL